MTIEQDTIKQLVGINVENKQKINELLNSLDRADSMVLQTQEAVALWKAKYEEAHRAALQLHSVVNTLHAEVLAAQVTAEVRGRRGHCNEGDCPRYCDCNCAVCVAASTMPASEYQSENPATSKKEERGWLGVLSHCGLGPCRRYDQGVCGCACPDCNV